MEADGIDPQAKEAMERQGRVPMPHSHRGLKLLRCLSSVATWTQNRNNPSVGETVDRTIPGPAGAVLSVEWAVANPEAVAGTGDTAVAGDSYGRS